MPQAMEVRRPRRAGGLDDPGRFFSDLIVVGFNSILTHLIFTPGGAGGRLRGYQWYPRLVRVWGRFRAPPPAGALSLGDSPVFASRETRKPLGKSAHFGADRQKREENRRLWAAGLGPRGRKGTKKTTCFYGRAEGVPKGRPWVRDCGRFLVFFRRALGGGPSGVC